MRVMKVSSLTYLIPFHRRVVHLVNKDDKFGDASGLSQHSVFLRLAASFKPRFKFPTSDATSDEVINISDFAALCCIRVELKTNSNLAEMTRTATSA